MEGKSLNIQWGTIGFMLLYIVYTEQLMVLEAEMEALEILLRCSLLYSTYADLTMYYDSLMKSRLPTTEAKMIPPRGLIVWIVMMQDKES